MASMAKHIEIDFLNWWEEKNFSFGFSFGKNMPWSRYKCFFTISFFCFEIVAYLIRREKNEKRQGYMRITEKVQQTGTD